MSFVTVIQKRQSSIYTVREDKLDRVTVLQIVRNR